MSLKQELIDKQARFWVLMAQGSTLTAACEAVGRESKEWMSLASGDRWSDPAASVPEDWLDPDGMAVPGLPGDGGSAAHYLMDVYAGIFVGFACYWACMFAVEAHASYPGTSASRPDLSHSEAV